MKRSGMKIITEAQALRLISHESAYEATEAALVAATDPGSTSFPTISGHGLSLSDRFSIKSGTTPSVTGLKVGTYFPGNRSQHGVENHGSTILLLHQETGAIEWIVESSKINGYRTAASDAVAAAFLAREDAQTLTVFGGGNQALFEVAALIRVRRFSRILVVVRNQTQGADFEQRLRNHLHDRDIHLEIIMDRDKEAACRAADVIATVTPSRTALFEAHWVSPGTHVVSMGSDKRGSQELPTQLFQMDHVSLFADLPSQSIVVGEFQNYNGPTGDITAIGDVISGKRVGRVDDHQITVYDSSGISLQDLFTAKLLVAAQEEENVKTHS